MKIRQEKQGEHNYMANQKVSVIIPTLNAGSELEVLLQALLHQNKKADEIIVIDSASDDGTPDLCAKYPAVKLLTIARQDFDHGGTRALAFNQASGDFVLFLTQDAVPADEHYIASLLAPFADEKVALVSGRQCAKATARLSEKLTREFNYPAQSNVRSEEDIKRLGIKAFFASDVCSAYRKSAYDAVGGFAHPILTNEDMLIAASFLKAGYKIAYAHEAAVLHSHNFTLGQQFKRNFDVGIFLKIYAQHFGKVQVDGEGIKMVKWVGRQLLESKAYQDILYYAAECMSKVLGNKLGKIYTQLPAGLVRKCSANKNYWQQLQK